ncbi:hypothetical protein NMY22_g13275 [Coprinellus aureogranulatus]|nr:hypothetical protein NMY22_g13275 [Coprinellus aureogranulatus]
MAKPTLFLLFASLVSIFFHSVVLAEFPSRCNSSCGVLDSIQACNSGDEGCICSANLISDAEECLSCAIDAGVDVSAVEGFQALLNAERLCEGHEVSDSPGSSPSSSATSPSSSSATSLLTSRLGAWPVGGQLLLVSLPLFLSPFGVSL